MRAVDGVLERLEGARKNGSGWKAQCPVPSHGKGCGDLNPSLSIQEGDDGRVLVQCFSGCSAQDIVNELGLRMSDLFPPNEHRDDHGSSRENSKPTAVWEIKDEAGETQAEHVRFDHAGKKKCLWRLPGRTLKEGLRGRKLPTLPLYGSERVHDHPDEALILAEGEKACDALLGMSFTALGTVTGAGLTPGPEALEILRDRVVILWPDNDEEGRKHMRRIASALRGVASEVRIFEWADAPPKGDAADHPATKDHEHVKELFESLARASLWEPGTPDGGKADDHGSSGNAGNIGNADGKNAQNIGNYGSGGEDSSCSASGNAGNADGRQPISAAELMRMEMQPVEWAVPDVLPAGVSLLAGPPKLGKSWFALSLAEAIAAGGVALGTKRVKQGETLYLALEDNRRRLRKRLQKVLEGREAPEGMHVATEWRRLHQGGVEDLREWLDNHPHTRFLCIDTLAKIREPARGQNVYGEDYASLEKLLPLAAEYNVAILVVHHLRKMGAADPQHEISGSTGLVGGVDGYLILRRGPGGRGATLIVDGRDIEDPAELALRWNQNTATWTIEGDAEEVRISNERADILLQIRRNKAPLSPKEIAELLEKKAGAVRKLIMHMVNDRQLVKTDEGKYSVTGVTGVAGDGNAIGNALEEANPDRSAGDGVSVTGVTADEAREVQRLK